MNKDGLLHTMLEGLRDACLIWRDEMRQVFRDEGVLIFFFIVPLA